MKYTWTIVLLFFISILHGQYDYYSGNTLKYWAENAETKLLIGAYGEIHYNQGIGGSQRNNGILDVHRLVLLNGYQFNKNISFLSEIEFEHINEITVEQAFLNYKISHLFNLQAGLLLVPMGILNEYHEPTTFYSVERPTVDNKIVPSTWREIGMGISGNNINLSLQYQLYVINGFLSYDGDARLNGSNGLRSGRQKGAEAIISSPNFTGKLNYYGVRGLQLGMSLFTGKSQSSLYDGIDRKDNQLKLVADSSAVYINMLGLDARYNLKKLHLRGQLNFVDIKNTTAYNSFSNSNLGNQLIGFYLEAAYTLFKQQKSNTQLILFSRFEHIDTHLKTSGDLVRNPSFSNNIFIHGLNWRVSDSAVFKLDFQSNWNKGSNQWNHQLNAGIGFWFR